MAGKPGMKGGGGARPGAGRKPAKPVLLALPATNDPLVFLRLVMSDNAADMKLRLAAAIAIMPFVHSKAEIGKKDHAQVAAQQAGAGRFGAASPPRLVARKP
jgi:phage terminase small subunit